MGVGGGRRKGGRSGSWPTFACLAGAIRSHVNLLLLQRPRKVGQDPSHSPSFHSSQHQELRNLATAES